ncbi:hypothetical protein [Methylobacterium sp. Leaf117]|uniref:hypothetical protein n=1 Tax=Methylobacterium sp. Leaf117 TaxID=1736260 RepID=UPI0006FBAA0E|nr:hypothetical protein [Methylobacterium sp. Leaf117]KQP96718.1 hypothetical protein ASF57_03045 [Methylobacterium sp. Leaf117]
MIAPRRAIALGWGLSQISRRRFFLQRVSCRISGQALRPLAVDAEFTRDNVDTACQALSLKLVNLVEEDDEGSYAFRLTRPGLLLLNGQIEAAAALIDQGFGLRRIKTPPLWGALGSKLRPGGPGMSLKGSGPRAYATQLIVAVASGHAIVAGDVVRGNANGPRTWLEDEPAPRAERQIGPSPLRSWSPYQDRDRPL